MKCVNACSFPCGKHAIGTDTLVSSVFTFSSLPSPSIENCLLSREIRVRAWHAFTACLSVFPPSSWRQSSTLGQCFFLSHGPMDPMICDIALQIPFNASANISTRLFRYPVVLSETFLRLTSPLAWSTRILSVVLSSTRYVPIAFSYSTALYDVKTPPLASLPSSPHDHFASQIISAAL